MKRIAALVSFCLLIAAGPANALEGPTTWAARPTAVRPSVEPTQIPGEVVVKYRTPADRSSRVALRSTVNAQQVAPTGIPGVEVLTVATDSVQGAIESLEDSPDVSYAEPNFLYEAAAVPDDPRLVQSWALSNFGQRIAGSGGVVGSDIEAPRAWNSTTGSKNVVVAVIDSGVAFDHPDLTANIWSNDRELHGRGGQDDDGNGYVDDVRGWDWVDDDPMPRDLLGHGTHVAGTIGAVGNNSLGMVGVSWKVSLMPLRTLTANGAGTSADVANAIWYANRMRADVINISLVSSKYSQLVADAITSARDSLVVVAAGNSTADNDQTPVYPCNDEAENKICVAATNQSDGLASFSNFGATSVDIAAPGSQILSTYPSIANVFYESFESDLASKWTWSSDGSPWQRTYDASGYYLSDSPAGPYGPDVDEWIQTSSPISLSGQQDCTLEYSLRVDTEANKDVFLVEGSVDGTGWTRLDRWTGTTDGFWLDQVKRIGQMDGESFFIRFRLMSDGQNESDGVSLDDVQVRCLRVAYGSDQFSYSSGTSMASPHVAGVAALLFDSKRGVSPVEVRSAIMGGSEPLEGLVGRVESAGRLSAAGALTALDPETAIDMGPAETPPVGSPDNLDLPTVPPLQQGGKAAHVRSVSLILKGHLRMLVVVEVPDGYAPCRTSAPLKVLRDGVVLRGAMTDEHGVLSLKLPDKPGRYRVALLAFGTANYSCMGAATQAVHHIHSSPST